MVGVVTSMSPESTGAIVSIRDTVAVVLQVFPAASTNSNVNELFPVNVYDNHELFVTVIASDQLIVAITFPFVIEPDHGIYETVAVGLTLSIQLTVAVVLPVFPTASLNVNVKFPFHVNV